MTQKAFKNLCSSFAVIYAGGGLLFALSPVWVVKLCNTVGTYLLGLKAAPYPAELFYSALAVGMMATIATCMLMAALNPSRWQIFLLPVFVEKCVSSSLGLLFFLILEANVAYLTLFVVDFPLALLSLYLLMVRLK